VQASASALLLWQVRAEVYSLQRLELAPEQTRQQQVRHLSARVRLPSSLHQTHHIRLFS
jgi:hypothetical protein